MNYQKIYDDICKRGQVRILPKEIYTERHHIIPKCLGGDNSKENLTILTSREHFLVHWILVELYPKNSKLKFAFWCMCNQSNEYQENRYIPSSRIYEYAKNIHSENISKLLSGKVPWNKGKKTPKEICKRISRSNMGKKMSFECIEKRKASRKGYRHTEETRRKMSESTKGIPKTEEFKQQVSNTMKGRPAHNKGKFHTEETKRKISESMKNAKRQKK